MKTIVIDSLAFEMTRRCNLVCEGFCMRGQSQKLDISKEYVDKILDSINREDVVVNNLLFSGGEPCLNEDMVVYIIEKIVKEDIPVNCIGLITNGHIISYPIIEAMEKFNYFKKIQNKNSSLGMGDAATIAVSRDYYHKPLSEYHLNQYRAACSAINFHDWFDDEKVVLKTGLANEGISYEYQLQPIICDDSDNDVIKVQNGFYLTATGFLTTNGDGSYCDMDINNLGHIQDIDLVEMIYDEINKHENIEKPITKKKQFFFGTLKNPR